MKTAISLNAAQQLMVEHNLSVVRRTVLRTIDINEGVCGMGYEDLYQEGCVALCHAAATYNAQAGAQFSTYAETVIRNHLLDHCRTLQAKRRTAQVISLDDRREDAAPMEYLASYDDTDRQIDRLYLTQLLEHGRRTFSGVAKLGIEAMELKVKGYSGADIAELYGVDQRHVGAWISRAAQKLKKDAARIETGSARRAA